MRGFYIVLLLLAPLRSWAASEEAFTDCHAYPQSKKFRWNVRGEVGVPDLVASISEISCRPIVLGPHVADRGKVVLQVPAMISAGEAYHLFTSALETLGLTLEESGRALKVVDLARGKEVARMIPEGKEAHGGDQFVLKLIRLAHARTDEIAEVLAKMRSKDGEVSVYPAARALIVSDKSTLIDRMSEMVAALDVPQEGARLFTLPVRSQKATELAATLEKIVDAGRKTAGKSSEVDGDVPLAIVPSDSSQLVVIVGSQRAYDRMAALAGRLDPDTPEAASGRAHVIYLSNTNAEEMAATLAQLGLGARSATPAPGAAAAPAAGRAVSLEGEVRIAADKISNALVVFASAGDFVTVRDLVAKLDIPRRQVYVEALIVDLSVDRTRDLGTAFHWGGSTGAGTAVVSDQTSSLNSVIVDSKSALSTFGMPGITAGLLGPAFNVFGMDVPSFGVVLRALERSKDVNVLSRPHLLTMDNVKAQISVGQKVMYPAQSISAPIAGGTSPSLALQTTYTPRDVSLALEVTPHLNDSDAVRLELDGKIQDIPDGQGSNPGGPTTNERTIKTSIVVPDGATVVLGGLEKDSESETIEKVPGLGSIPVLGRLFQYRSKLKIKQELLIVLTPYVIRGPDDLRRIAEQREQDEREFLARFSAFKDAAAFDAHADYGHARGLLAEIVRIVRDAEEDASARREAARALKPEKPRGAVESR